MDKQNHTNGLSSFCMDKKKHINILIDRVSLCYYKIEKAVFYFTDLFKIILYDAIYIFVIVRNITNDKNI